MLYQSITNSAGNLTANSYTGLLTEAAFWNSVLISLSYSVGSTFLALILGLTLAFLVTQDVRGKGFFQALYIFPMALAPIVVGVTWSPSSIFDDMETFWHFILKLPYFNVLSPGFYFPVMILSEAWEWAPLIMLVGLSVINSGSREVYESAKIHGASSLQVFRLIALPSVLRSPVMQFVVVLRLIDALRAFEIPLAWSNWVGYQTQIGSPVDTLSLFLYKLIFVPIYGFPISTVSSVSVLLLAFTLVAATVLLRIMRATGRQV